MDKEKEIEEMVGILEASNNPFIDVPIDIMTNVAEALYNAGYRKGETISYQAMIDHSYIDRINELENRLIEVRKETAKEILERLYNWKSAVIFDSDSITAAEKSFENAIKALAEEEYGVEVEE